jgi:hypothetical protein
MNKVAGLAVALVLIVAVTGCWGPQVVTRSFDDWLNEGYVHSPWLFGNVVSYMAWSLGFMFTNLADGFINTYYFWVTDAQPFGSGTGTRFEHTPVTPK